MPNFKSALCPVSALKKVGFGAMPSHFCVCLMIRDPVTLWHIVGMLSHALIQCRKALMSLKRENKYISLHLV